MYYGKFSTHTVNLPVGFGKQVTSKMWKVGAVSAFKTRSAIKSYPIYS
jgi:hypothetical protein